MHSWTTILKNKFSCQKFINIDSLANDNFSNVTSLEKELPTVLSFILNTVF